ncbi:MAG: hypothetical protein ACYDDO_15420 [Acidiferrobacterales bacterium]
MLLVERAGRALVYPANSTRDRKESSYVVSFRYVPEAITHADSANE